MSIAKGKNGDAEVVRPCGNFQAETIGPRPELVGIATPEEDIEALVLAHLHPLLPGAKLNGPITGPDRPTFIVTHDTGHRLLVYASPSESRYYVFDRTVPFSNEERIFCETIVKESHEKARRGELVDSSASEVVARTISNYISSDCADILFRVIKAYESWKKPAMGHTMGIRPMRSKRTCVFDFSEQMFENWSTDQNNLMAINQEGIIVGLEKITSMAAAGSSKKAGRALESAVRVRPSGHPAGVADQGPDWGQEVLAPIVWANIAEWAGSARRVAVRLSEDGQILIFNRKRLLFAKRSGYWHCLPHTLIDIQPIPDSIDGVGPETIKAVYLTALDLAASRKKALIEIIRGDSKNYNATGADRSKRSHSVPADYLKKNRKFSELHRSVRAEICASCGTLFIDGDGYILDAEMNREIQKAGKGGLNRYAEAPIKIFPGSGYMELLNSDKHSNLHLSIRSNQD